MHRCFRKILGVIGLGVNWGVVWGTFFFALMTLIGAVRLLDVDPGEWPLPVGATGALAGFLSGLTYGLIVSVVEDRKSLTGLRISRVTLWGLAASAAWPLINHLPPDRALIVCLLGGFYAAISAAVARRFELHRGRPSLIFMIAGRSVRDPLRSACAPEPEPPE